MIHIHHLQGNRHLFHLQTSKSSYVMMVHTTGHLLKLYYGRRLMDTPHLESFYREFTTGLGSSTAYHSQSQFNLDVAPCEVATSGKGDYREPSVNISYAMGDCVSDFIFESYEITQDAVPSGLPHIHNERAMDTLILNMVDPVKGIGLSLYYTPVEEADALVRWQRVKNRSTQPARLERFFSFNLDFENAHWHALTLDGMWIRERQINSAPLRPGILTIDSKKGVSGANHSPNLFIHDPCATEQHGDVYGFGLLYSGNYSANIEVSPYQMTRVQMGISHHDFSWELLPEESFDSPQGVLVYSYEGFNGVSHGFHTLINNYIIAKRWQRKARPVLINNWEATYFDFNEKKILALAKEASSLGIELFVLDDGWFKGRHDDKSSLGDWVVDEGKLPKGLGNLSKRIQKLGMSFGLWVEPEMISPNSDLFRKHPTWAVMLPDRKPSLGRHQLILDLCNPDVVDYLYQVLSKVFKEAEVSYVKWDMNRNMSDVYSHYLPADAQKRFYHAYMLGLYDLLSRLNEAFPHVLFESCSSGGNRFDMGMLYYMPQTWTSDNTDAVERMEIQYGTSMVFPLSTMGAHVSGKPSHQVLRHTPLETRFNVAAFGLLGYELDVTRLSIFEKKVIKKQIAFYKAYRDVLQFGSFYRGRSPFLNNDMTWQVVNEAKDVFLIGHYQKLQRPSPPLESIYPQGLDETMQYLVKNRVQYMDIRAFGELINPYIPVNLKDGGILQSVVANRYLHKQEQQVFQLSGDALMYAGMRLKAPFVGTGIDEQTRLLGDFGSRLYVGECIIMNQKGDLSHE